MESNERGIEEAVEVEQDTSQDAGEDAVSVSSSTPTVEIFKVICLPNKTLRQRSIEVSDKDMEHPQFDRIIQTLINTMYESEGVGISAVQCNLLKRIAVIDPEFAVTKEKNPTVLINPEIVRSEGSQKIMEGCLSVIELGIEVERASEVEVCYYDYKEKELRSVVYTDFSAQVVQHEIDHMNGKLIYDYLSGLRKDIYDRKIRKMIKRDPRLKVMTCNS